MALIVGTVGTVGNISKWKEIKGVLSENRGNTGVGMIIALVTGIIALIMAELVISKITGAIDTSGYTAQENKTHQDTMNLIGSIQLIMGLVILVMGVMFVIDLLGMMGGGGAQKQ